MVPHGGRIVRGRAPTRAICLQNNTVARRPVRTLARRRRQLHFRGTRVGRVGAGVDPEPHLPRRQRDVASRAQGTECKRSVQLRLKKRRTVHRGRKRRFPARGRQALRPQGRVRVILELRPHRGAELAATPHVGGHRRREQPGESRRLDQAIAQAIVRTVDFPLPYRAVLAAQLGTALRITHERLRRLLGEKHFQPREEPVRHLGCRRRGCGGPVPHDRVAPFVPGADPLGPQDHAQASLVWESRQEDWLEFPSDERERLPVKPKGKPAHAK